VKDGYVRKFCKFPKGRYENYWSALEDDFRTFLLMPGGSESIFSSLQPKSCFPPKSMSVIAIYRQLFANLALNGPQRLAIPKDRIRLAVGWKDAASSP
jgi:hypothetical protein